MQIFQASDVGGTRVSTSARQIVIVGASAAGLRCAARLKRLQPTWSITVVEQRPVFSVAACGLPYVLSGDIAELTALRQTADGTLRDREYFDSVKGVAVLAGCRALSIDVVGHRLRVADQAGERTLEWDELVLATGARPRRLPGQPEHPRVRSFHDTADLEPVLSGLQRSAIKRVVIVGAGLVGCELAEAFGALWGAQVTLVEAAATPLPELLAPETGAVVAQVLRRNGIDLRTGAPVQQIAASDDRASVQVSGAQIEGDLVVVAVGVEPAVELPAAAGVAIGRSGAIAVDERLATSLPHVWAAGDCIESRHVVTDGACYLPLGSLANRQGRTLANNLAGRVDQLPPVAGAQVVKIFDWTAAAVGLTPAAAQAAGIAVRSVWLAATDRADYWPEAKELLLQLSYEPGSERLLGVQAVGQGDVVKRIDVATQLIARRATLHDVAQLEHAYAPPFAPAIDPLASAAFVALNQQDGVVAVAPASLPADAALLDVRHAAERAERPLANGASHAVPLAELRRRVDELRGRDWLVVCARGGRSAEAVRVLQAAGIAARYAGGGRYWMQESGLLPADPDATTED